VHSSCSSRACWASFGLWWRGRCLASRCSPASSASSSPAKSLRLRCLRRCACFALPSFSQILPSMVFEDNKAGPTVPTGPNPNLIVIVNAVIVSHQRHAKLGDVPSSYHSTVCTAGTQSNAAQHHEGRPQAHDGRGRPVQRAGRPRAGGGGGRCGAAECRRHEDGDARGGARSRRGCARLAAGSPGRRVAGSDLVNSHSDGRVLFVPCTSGGAFHAHNTASLSLIVGHMLPVMVAR